MAVYNRTVPKAEAIAKKFNVPKVYGDSEELFQKEELDFADIITEVPGHAPLVYLAAKHQVPVICQKPMAPDYKTAQRMVEAARQAGIPFFVHENFRWQTPIRALKQVLDGGHIGEPFRARIQFVHALEPVVWANQPLLKTLEQLILADMGSHLLDIARFLFGAANSLYCQSYRSRDDIVGEDVASVMLRMGDVICNCEMSFSTKTEWVHFPEVFIYVEGKRGTAEVAPDFWVRTTNDKGTHAQRHVPPRYEWADPDYSVAHASMVPIHRDFLRALQTGGSPETTGEDNLKTMHLVYAAYESARLNQVITFS